ncbi:MAG: hypothetical protein A3G25_07175 [Betaproteobacteria bacterium RIFCSPLOWO2_12_FULL_63_13]|nr:MAG: hypothetical protein A3H32_13165 [Betaproteobacteria bacterium RIFCSPLOWO2_02_FULL_63_19]OGA42585.1 MAG: hypothetical protein A3G25_07175 [Betaproteobacteria bacterium RIFCSPLOWO2_12_FULL_63_13]
MSNAFDRTVIRFLIVSRCYFNLPIAPAHTEMISTYRIAGAHSAQASRQELQRYREREDVRAGLEKDGVTQADAKARVDAITDDDATAVADKIDSLPGGRDFIGALDFAFLLLTDIPGFTKVYSFTRLVGK